MSNGDGGVSFGFAPHGRPNQPQDKQPAFRQADELGTATAMPVSPSSSAKTNLAWLFIGVLLGAGGTLIGSSIWLQGSYVNPSVAMDASPSSVAEAKVSSETLSGPKEAAAERSEDIDDAITPSAGSVEDIIAALDNEDNRVNNDKASIDRGQVAPSANAERRLDPEKRSQGEALLISSNEGDPNIAVEPDEVIEETIKTTALESVDKRVEELTTNQQADEGNLAIAAVDSLARTLNTDSVSPTTEKPPMEAVSPKPASTTSSEKRLDAKTAEPNDGGSNLRTGEKKPLTQLALDKADASSEKPVSTEIANVIQTANTDKPANGAAQSSKRIYRVQLAAVDNENAAETFWQEVTTNQPDLFADVEPIFDRREVDERIFFRIWIGEFEKRVDADDYCGWLKGKGQDCFVTRG